MKKYEIKELPKDIKKEIKNLNDAVLKVSDLSMKIEMMLSWYGVSISDLDCSEQEIELNGEGFAFIINGECRNEDDFNDTLADIEQAFVKLVNKMRSIE